MEKPKNQVIEVSTFKTKPGIEAEAFAIIDAELEAAYTSKQPGYISRTSGLSENGEWLVIIRWEDAASAVKAMSGFMQDVSVAGYAAMIDGETLVMKRYQVKN